jgi:hypothetical protein
MIAEASARTTGNAKSDIDDLLGSIAAMELAE